MSLNPIAWIRATVRDAVLAGIGDALAQLDAGDDVHAAAARLQCLATLPAPSPGPGHPDSLPAPGRRRHGPP
jgi:hypothetical protein